MPQGGGSASDSESCSDSLQLNRLGMRVLMVTGVFVRCSTMIHPHESTSSTQDSAQHISMEYVRVTSQLFCSRDKMYPIPPPPLRKQAESQENDGQTGFHV